MADFSAENVTRVIREVVAEKGEYYIYPKTSHGDCVYAVDGAPSCIVGHVIARIDPESFAKVVQIEEDSSYGINSAAMVARLGLDVSGPVNTGLMEAQDAQDNGLTWGVALNSYEKVLALYS